jgi:hypothetical protein
MNFEDIHGIDKRYKIYVNGAYKKDKVFAISGYGRLEKKKEKRFAELISKAPSITFTTTIERF